MSTADHPREVTLCAPMSSASPSRWPKRAVAHHRATVDLADKPDWFLAMSPLGRTPVLKVGDAVLFESAAILEYLEGNAAPPAAPPPTRSERARHRALDRLSARKC